MSSRSFPLPVILSMLLCQCCGGGDIPPSPAKTPHGVLSREDNTDESGRSESGDLRPAEDMGRKNPNGGTTPFHKSVTGSSSNVSVSQGDASGLDTVSRARKLLRLGFGKAAITLLDSDPALRSSCDYWLLTGEALLYMGRWEAAVAQTIKGGKVCSGSKSIPLKILYARAQAYASRWRRVLPAVNKVLESTPDNRDAHRLKLEALKHLRRRRDLREALNDALSHFPNDAELKGYEVWYLFAAGNPEAALKMVRTLADDATAPGYVRAGWLDFLGTFYARRKMYGRAQSILNECTRRFRLFGCPGTALLLAPKSGRKGFARIVRTGRHRRGKTK